MAWNSSVARTDVTSTALFGADRAGVAQGVWAGQGVTRTKPSRTLFIAGIPRGANRGDIEALFRGELGFSAVRAVGRMLFVDFASESYATAAMRKHQGRAVGGAGEALLIDFDRDAGAAVRAKKRSLAQEQEEAQRQASALVPYFCMLCRGQRLFALAPIDGVMLPGMPKRSSGDFCVEEEKFLKHVDMLPAGGEPKLIRRPGGLEVRHELVCPTCRLPVAYRPVPLATPTKYLYVLADAVCWSQAARVPAQRWAAEEAAAAAAAAGGGGAQAAGERAAAQRRRLDADGSALAGAPLHARDDAADGDGNYGACDPHRREEEAAHPVTAAAPPPVSGGALGAAATSGGSSGEGVSDGATAADSAGLVAAAAAAGPAAAADPARALAALGPAGSGAGGDASSWPAALRARAAAVLGVKGLDAAGKPAAVTAAAAAAASQARAPEALPAADRDASRSSELES